MPSYLAPAKINLTLEVLARREDGYHALRSVMVPLALADEIQIEPSERFAFECGSDGLGGNDNLVVRAAAALGALPPVKITLTKRIPSQAGLGGGSSDAAAVLRAAMDGALGTTSGIDWLQTARALGSDVPFFLAGTAALVEGTGERVTPAGALPPWHVLVVKPPAAVSTADAYAAIDRTQRPSRARSNSVSIDALTALQRFDFDAVERLLQNDFHDVIASSVAEVATAVDALHGAGARRALLSGSGSCVFTLAADRERIEAIASRLHLPSAYAVYQTQFASTPAWR
ncbi:MAG TPA: 4-(cytidine 5'-diphospho)-2-C-methyl-D-erythritol kinase [Candidatus Acidoferrales bacterium]|jgi:4-diphosphocytidyl-2-C-methyl-D-erythritol kinase|nr:4-(cytidine 5'-diphospho)-2-C-methyl-D-erythritol kinase [Candidatus Acidoferrales bacterium]